MMGTLIDVFWEQVGRNPQHVAVMDAHGAYTYAQLNRRSAILAKHLLDKQQALKIEGKRMAVLLPRSRDFLVAMLGILRAGCAAVPLDSEYPAERINTILEDAGCSLCISTRELSSKIEAVSLLNLDENLQELRNADLVDESLNLSDPAVEGLLLFTSGSTGKPKGVVHRQSIFSSGAHVLKGYHEFTKKDVTCCMAGFTFVVSTNDLYAPLTGGGSVYIADEMERKNVTLLYQIIRKHGVTGMYLPPQMFNVMRELYGRLPLEYILLSGEKVQTKYAADNNLLEFYGSTETVGSLVHRITDDSHRTLGKPCGGAEVYLLSESGERITEPKAVGEFCVAGPYVAIGYNNLPEETAAKFTENPFKAGGGLLYHSGDYMALDEEGNLIFHGRKDRMVKLRGYRVELGEIENAMMRAEGVSEAACVLTKVHGSDKLCCYYTGEKTLEASTLAAHGKNVLPEYMVPDYFVCLEKLPRNERNKVNYLALPGLDLAAARENVPPETEAEGKIFEVATEILGTKEFGVTDDLVSLGLTSIGAMRLAAELSRACALHIPVAEILRTPTIRALAAYAEGEIPGAGKKFSPHLKRKLYPITENQRGIIIDWEQNCGSTQYNIPAVTVFDGVEGESLVCAVKAALDAHGYLKTRFRYADGDVMQQRREEDASVVSLTEFAKEPDRAFFQDRVQPFDLFSERLYRLEVYTFGKRAWLFLDIHHTVYDGLSGNVFLEEVRRALAGEKLRGERLTAYDFALYEQELCGSETYAEAKAYFDKLAEGAVPAVLPDSTKPDGKAAGTFTLQMPAGEINDFCQSCGVTPGSFFEAAFGETLRRLTREEKPFYLTVSSGRSASPLLMDSVGMFAKTLPVMLQNSGDMTAKEYVEEIHRQLQETYKRELYPYTELVEKHGLRGEIMFVYQGGILEEREGVVSQLLAMDTARFPVLAMVTPEKDAYRIDLEYDGRRYGLADMTGLARAFGTAALSLAWAKELRDVQLVDESEARELLRLGAGRKMERDDSETIVDILEKRVAESPDAPAVVYHQKTLTYRELDNITTRLAVFLQKTYQVGVGDIVGVMIDRSELMLIYPLAIIKTGAAYMPLDPAFPTERLSFMCEDAKVRLILSEHHRVAGKLPDFAGGCFESDALSSLPEVTAAEIAALTPPNAHDLFIILFTSGTTGKPKAVELEHYSIANFCHWYVQEYGMNMDDHVAAFSNFGFDAHMMDLYPSILAGSTVYIFDSALRMNLVAMNAYMEENMITVAFFTTQIGCMVSKINHSLRCLSAGGEKMPPLTAPDFRFLNGYGPTECSIYSTYYDVQGYYEGKLIGRPLPNYQVFIVDKGGNLVPRGISGELLIAGQGVARGYMNRPELNAEKFINFRPSPEREPIRAYRSGDLVRWSEDGNIEYLGRIDNQVKLRGLRIEMGEIENRAGQYEGLEQVAAAVRKDQLVLYYTASEGAEIDTAKLRDFLAQTLTEYMVPTVYMPLAVMPMTLNGKIDRKALPEPEISFALENVQPETEGEKKIFEVAAEILGTKDFGVTDNLVSLGLSSIRAMRLAAGLDQACALRIPVAEILRTPTVRALAAWSEGEIPGAGKQISPYPKRERYPITENQRGIIIDWEQNRETTQYNIPAVNVFDGVEGETLVCAVKAAVDAHGYLKTRFLYADGDVMQQRREEDAPVVSLTELDQEPDPSFFQGRILPFDLFAENLYRLEIYTFENHTWLFSDIHHTVYDGLSVNVFLEEVHRALAGEKLCGETLTAYDFALYEQELRGSETYAEAKAYFDRLAEGAVPAVLSDSPKPDEKPAGTFTLQIPAKEINHFCQSCGVTPGSFFEAAFGETLRRLTREEKPFYLTVSNGRSASPALMDSVGMFVKTLPVVMQNSGDMTAKAYVEGIHRQLQETYAREFYPYTELVENHGLRGEIMFVYQGGLSDGEAMESARPASMELELNAAKLPLSVELLVSENDYVLLAEYDGLRYKRAAIESLAKMVKNVALGLVKETYVKDVQLVSSAEAKEILELSAGEKLNYDTSGTWLDLYRKHVQETPAKTAVVDSTSAFTYGELDIVSNSIAAYLLAKGVAAGDFVALKMGRVKEFLAAVIAVHKVGAAYVPIDPAYPAERIAYMLEDSEARAVLTEETVDEALAKYPEAASINHAATESKAYMIYTSGSTGKPKGVVQSHRSLRALVAWRLAKLDITENSVHAVHASFSFDASLNDLINPIAAGGTLHIIPEDMRNDISAMKEYFAKNHVDVISLSAQIGMVLVNQYPNLPLRYLIMGGEKMLPCKKTNIRLINEYGPTEFTVCSSYHVVDQEVDQDIPIGRPVPNTWSFICDSYGHLLPQGVMGELCLAGNQLAEGYWKKPELTAKSFVDCPFLPGQKMYRTGDLARYNENGELEYLGRIDNQVKLRGFRIEMGEIENHAGQYEGMEQVAAAVRQDQLVLYYTASEGAKIDTAKLRDFLAKSLTEYMVPTVYMPLAVMPMTPNGKIDRRALPRREASPLGEPDIAVGTENVPPENRLEENCLRIAGEVLHGITFGVTDDLMTLGLNSLKAMLLVNQWNTKLRMRLRVSDLTRYKTIRGCILGKRRISWLHEEYDEKKPTLVFVQGIVMLSDTAHLHDLFAEYFNVLVIEPIQNHYDKMFLGEHFDDVAAFYLTSLEILLPEEAKVAGFIGFSFGGATAFAMAVEWKKMTGQSVPVILGDTVLLIPGKLATNEIKRYTVEELRGIKDSFEFKEHDYTEEELQATVDLYNMVEVIVSENSMEPYDGEVIFLNAHRNSTEEAMRNKLAVLRRNAPQAEIHEFSDYSHEAIYVAEELHPFYRDVARRLK